MPRISIYVPDAMKERMDALGDRHNWSNLAQEAFDQVINAPPPLEDKKLQSVVERLRQSKIEETVNAREDGREYGRRWAERIATFKQLKIIGGLDAEDDLISYEREDMAEFNLHQALKIDVGERPELGLFFEPEHPRAVPSDEYVIGFVEGAQEIWKQVEDQI